MLPPTEVKPKIGIIAGQGSIPEALVSRWESQGLVPVIVGLKGITDPSLFTNRSAAEFSIGQVGHILHFLQSHGVRQLVMMGALKRPNLWTIIPDGAGFKILARLLWCHSRSKLGDDRLLRFVRREIERYGIDIIGAHEFMPELLSPAGVLTRTPPDSVTQTSTFLAMLVRSFTSFITLSTAFSFSQLSLLLVTSILFNFFTLYR